MTDSTEIQRVIYTEVRQVLVETDGAGVTRFVVEQASGTTTFNLRDDVMEFNAGHLVSDEIPAWERETRPHGEHSPRPEGSE